MEREKVYGRKPLTKETFKRGKKLQVCAEKKVKDIKSEAKMKGEKSIKRKR